MKILHIPFFLQTTDGRKEGLLDERETETLYDPPASKKKKKKAPAIRPGRFLHTTPNGNSRPAEEQL